MREENGKRGKGKKKTKGKEKQRNENKAGSEPRNHVKYVKIKGIQRIGNKWELDTTICKACESKQPSRNSLENPISPENAYFHRLH